MPLTLITGPANAAKAGAVLERFRAALPREPVLVVPTAADAEHYQRELSAEGIVVGAEVVDVPAAGPRARGGHRRARARRSGRSRASGSCARWWPRRTCEVLARSAAAPGFPAAADALFAELGRSLIGPARFTRAVRDWEASGEAPAHARRARGPVLRLPPPARARSAPSTREGLARAALDALRERPGRLGRPAGVPLRLRRPDAAAARHGRDARPPRRRLRRARLRAGPRGVRRPGGDGRAAQAARRAPRAARTTAPSTTRPTARAALHHLERELFEPGAAGGRPTARSGCWRPAASAPRPSWSPPRCSS